MSSGDFSALVTRQFSATLLVVAAVALVAVLLASISRMREETFRE